MKFTNVARLCPHLPQHILPGNRTMRSSSAYHSKPDPDTRVRSVLNQWEEINMTLLKNALRTATATAMLAGMSATAFAQEVTIKMHQFLPAQANVPKLVLDVWAKNVEESSDGRIKVDHYPSMQLGGKPPELIDQAIDGVAD